MLPEILPLTSVLVNVKACRPRSGVCVYSPPTGRSFTLGLGSLLERRSLTGSIIPDVIPDVVIELGVGNGLLLGLD